MAGKDDIFRFETEHISSCKRSNFSEMNGGIFCCEMANTFCCEVENSFCCEMKRTSR